MDVECQGKEALYFDGLHSSSTHKHIQILHLFDLGKDACFMY